MCPNSPNWKIWKIQATVLVLFSVILNYPCICIEEIEVFKFWTVFGTPSVVGSHLTNGLIRLNHKIMGSTFMK